RVQSARRARRDLGHRARRLHRPRARPRPRRRPGLLRVARAARLPDGEEVSEATLLVELLTEELPPKSLKELSEAFSSRAFADRKKDGLLAGDTPVRALASPRRLAFLASKVKDRSADTERDVQGPLVTAAPQAVAGFAKKNGVAVEALKKQKGPKG